MASTGVDPELGLCVSLSKEEGNHWLMGQGIGAMAPPSVTVLQKKKKFLIKL